MTANGAMIGEYDIPTPASGARCILATSNGRVFFTQYDIGAIGEIIFS
jgi:virginiamycin B lyase